MQLTDSEKEVLSLKKKIDQCQQQIENTPTGSDKWNRLQYKHDVLKVDFALAVQSNTPDPDQPFGCTKKWDRVVEVGMSAGGYTEVKRWKTELLDQ